MKDKEKNVIYGINGTLHNKEHNIINRPHNNRPNDIKLPKFFDQKDYKILNPYNFALSLQRLQSLDEEYFMKDIEGFQKKEFDLEFDQEDKYTCQLEDLMILTDFKEKEDQDTLNLIKLVDFGQYINNQTEKKIEFKLYEKKKEISIKVFVDMDYISKNIDYAMKNSPFQASRGLVPLAKQAFNDKNSKKTPELDMIIKFNYVKKVYETPDESIMIIELTNPPLYKTNFLKIEEGIKKNEYENIIFPFRNFSNDIANLKYKKFYMLLRSSTSNGEDNNKIEFNIHGNMSVLRNFFDIISDKIQTINYNLCSESDLRRKFNLDYELNEYFSIFYDKFITNLEFDIPSLISFNYNILVLVSENILSYFNAVAYLNKIIKYNDYSSNYFRFELDNENFKSFLYSEALVKLVELYKSTDAELTLAAFELELASLYNDCKIEYDINGENAFKKKNKRLIRNMRVIVTPTYTLFMPYIEDQGNRILREHRDPWEAMRLVFKMDDFQDAKWNNKFLTEFIKLHLLKGLQLALSNYDFFCYSQSQFRSMGCWLVINPDEILKKTGDYSNIKIIAKYGARVGQTLTSTTKTIKIHERDIIFHAEDVTNGTKYVFSDGVGTITYDLAREISRKLGLDEVPAAFQGRFLGCKGVWTVLFNDHSTKICIRPSQNKFEKKPEGSNQRFEVCGYSKFIKSYLNRQVILLLSALGIEDEVFMKKLFAYRNRLEDEKFILSLIHYDEWNSMFMRMYLSGVDRSNDRLVRSIVSANKEILYRDLKKKARIHIEEGAYVTGIMDEFGVLEYGEAFLKVKNENIEMVVDKSCPVAKCPCLHPGDVRVLNFKKYNKDDIGTKKYEQLEIYENVLVFPQKGKRPHPNELSGSDLDGDQYFIFYDADLRNVKREVEPMDYSDDTVSIKKDNITRKDIIEFFAEYINNNNLGTIADAHLAHSDADIRGADGELPKILAKKFSLAVDAPKTGAKVILTDEEEAKQFPHYMGREYKSYHSNHVLGKLYDRTVKFIEEIDEFKSQNHKFYDEELILRGHQSFKFEGLIYYIKYYEELLGVLKKNDIQNESELLTGNNIDNDGSGFAKKKNNYDVIEKIAIQMKELFTKYKGYFNESSKYILGEKNLNYQLRNKQSERASAFYYVCYDILKIIDTISKNSEELDEMKWKFQEELYEDAKFNDDQAGNDYSNYLQATCGGEFGDQIYSEDAYLNRVCLGKENIRNRLENCKALIYHFITEKTKMFKIPNSANDENQFRILSFPWCTAGDILIKIKDLL